MNRVFRMALCGAAASMLVAGATASYAADNSMKSTSMKSADAPMVGGAPMYPSKTIVENASKADNLTTLVSAVKEAGLVETLSGKGPFTVFAPTNEAFSKLPKATVADLMKPANKEQLSKILTYHVVEGDLSAKTLKADLKKGNGEATFKTVEGGMLTVKRDGNHMTVTDAKGHTARISQADVKQANGTVYVIGSVLMPS